jgi:4-deoxy-L-threo-5-hexosulose-uronate ketol-isomerase
MDFRYASHPDAVKGFDTEKLRTEFLIEKLFVANELNMTYSHYDRIIAGGVVPTNSAIKLEGDAREMGADYFLERREIGIINIGAKGTVLVDGQAYEMENKDGLYIGKGAKEVLFQSENPEQPAKFYINSTPAHHTYPTVKVAISEIVPTHLGSITNSNERTIYKYFHPDGVQSCQLVMGLTMLAPGNMWNSMPCHTHDRRMEVYLYFDMPADAIVVHLMGQPEETRHLIVRNEQAIISPNWSIHTGVATSNYTFIWGMAGENQTYTDMDAVAMTQLK